MNIIPVRGNMLGVGMFVMSGLLAGLLSIALELPDTLVMIIVGSDLIGMDMVFRLRARPDAGWLTKRELGGYFFFMPVWCVGLVVMLANLIRMVIK